MTWIKGIRIRNWARFRGEHELDLPSGVLALVAEDSVDPTRSNYLGKSALMAAIQWALFGGTVLDYVDTIDEQITRGEDECLVDLDLSDGTLVSRLKRRGRSVELVLEFDQGLSSHRVLSGEGAQEEIVRRVVGMSRDDYLSTAFSIQREAGQLVRATAGQSTKQIEGWLGLERLAGAWRIETDRLARLTGERDTAASELQQLLALNGELPEAERQLDERTREYEQEVERYDRELVDRDRIVEERASFDKRLDLAQLERELKKLRVAEPSVAVPDKDPDLDRRVGEAITRTDTCEQAVKRLKVVAGGRFDGACPASPGFGCPATQQINERRTENATALTSATQELEKARVADNELQTKRRIALQKRETALRDESRQQEREASRQRKLVTHEASIAALREQGIRPALEGETPPEVPARPDPPDPLPKNLAATRVEHLRKGAGLVQDAQQRVDRLTGEREVVRAAARVLGPAGARRRAAERAVLGVEREANQVLERAGVDLRVRADWERELKALADHCDDCGTTFPRGRSARQCVACGAARGPKMALDFRWRLSHYSGAAEDLGGIALRCGAFRLLRAGDAVLTLAVFDEPAAQFDRAHRRAFAQHLRRLLESTFEQAIVSAHSDDVLAGCEGRIRIVGVGDDSRIEVR